MWHKFAFYGYFYILLLVGLRDYHDSTRYRDSLSLFTVVIVDCLTI